MTTNLSGHLFERDAELARVVDALEAPAAVLVVTGEPGVGKTRLIQEALGSAAVGDRRILLGGAQRLYGPSPLAPVLEALVRTPLAGVGPLPAVCGALRALLPEIADRLPAAAEPLADAEAERERVLV